MLRSAKECQSRQLIYILNFCSAPRLVFWYLRDNPKVKFSRILIDHYERIDMLFNVYRERRWFQRDDYQDLFLIARANKSSCHSHARCLYESFKPPSPRFAHFTWLTLIMMNVAVYIVNLTFPSSGALLIGAIKWDATVVDCRTSTAQNQPNFSR